MIAIVALPALWAAGSGAVISVVAEEPEPTSDTNQMLPPEMAGMRLMIRTVFPVVVCCVGCLPVLAARLSVTNGGPPAAGALQAAMGVVLVVGLTVSWVRFREPARIWWRSMLKDSQEESAKRAALRARS